MTDTRNDKLTTDDTLLMLVELVRQSFKFNTGAVVFDPGTEDVTHLVFSLSDKKIKELITEGHYYDVFNYNKPENN